VLAGDEQWYIEEAKKAGVTINYVIDTHVHADHYSGGRKLAAMVGAPYCLHESDKGLVKFEFEPLSDGQSLNLGNVNVEVLHTPGHTPDSICLLVTDMRAQNCPGSCSPATRCSSVPSVAPTCWGASGRCPRNFLTAYTPSCCICRVRSKSTRASGR